MIPMQPMERNAHELLAEQNMLLTEILTELRRANSTAREGAVSSVEVKFLANGTPQPTVKAYSGSVPPVAEAIEAYGRTVLMAQAGALAGWQATVDALAGNGASA